ncbi:MAG: choice-of-anchor Q domain-containing protein, partial [Planctomycetota bacterium]
SNTTYWAQFGCATQLGYHWSNVTIANSVIWFDQQPNPLNCYYGDPAAATYSNIQGGYSGTGNIDADPLFVDAANGDFRLLPGSPCIDAGDPADLACGADVFGNPRRLDGGLDGNSVADMGACEFSHVRLDVSGTPTPGGTLDIDVTGTLGLPAMLFAGSLPGEACASHYGTLFFDPLQPWLLWPWGTLPSSVSVPIDPSVPSPLEVVLQAAALAPGVPAGNTSNAVLLTID